MSHYIIAIVDNPDALTVSQDPFHARFPWPDHVQGLALTDACHLSDLNRPALYCAPLTLDTLPLQLTNGRGHSLTLDRATSPEMAGVAPPEALLQLSAWMPASTDRWWLIPWPLVAVARALFNIHALDPYLGAHYARQLSHILSGIPADQWLTALSKHSDAAVISMHNDHFVHQFRQFEKKIVRQYATHP